MGPVLYFGVSASEHVASKAFECSWRRRKDQSSIFGGAVPLIECVPCDQVPRLLPLVVQPQLLRQHHSGLHSHLFGHVGG